MKSKFLLLFLSLFMVVGGVKAWTSTGPSAGKFYIYNPQHSVYLKATNAVTDNIAEATVFTLSGSSNFTIAYSDNGTKYVYENKGEGIWGTSNDRKWNVDSNNGGYYIWHYDPDKTDFVIGRRARYIAYNGTSMSYPHEGNGRFNTWTDDDNNNRRWQLIPVWTVTFNPNNGSASSTVLVPNADPFNFENPSKTGYHFTGWFSGTNQYTNQKPITSDVELTASWDANQYTITFNANGGNAVESQSPFYDGDYSLPTPTRTGYEFDGWYLGETKWENIGTYTTASDVELTAHWTANTYDVTFNANYDGGTVETIPQGATYDASVDYLVSRQGYTFSAWYTEPKNGTVVDTWTFTENKTLYAHWTPNTYKVTFNLNNGSAVRTETATYDEAWPTIENPTYAGYDFAGWFYEDGTQWDEAGKNYTIDGPVALKAKWTRKLQVNTIPYATFYLDKNYIMPDGVTGSYVSAVSGKTSGKLTVTDVYFAGDIVPANVPLLLSADIKDYILEITDEEGTIVEGNNCLHGQLTAGTIQKVDGDNYYYKLAVGSKGSANEGKPGFYWGVDGGGVFSMTGNNRAYLVLPKEANVKSFSFENGLETAITDVVEAVNSNDAVYNVAGQRVTSATRGMYIKNGKKYLVK